MNRDDVFRETCRQSLAAWDLSADAHLLDAWSLYYARLVEANAATNLTRITDPAPAAIRHFIDSLALAKWLAEAAHDTDNRTSRVAKRLAAAPRVLDVGTGPGFPALPLANFFPRWQVTAIDGRGRKIDFVRAAASEAGIDNLDAVHAHSTHYQPDRPFDAVLLRAVGSIATCLQAASALTTKGGLVVLYKSAGITTDERRAGEAAKAKLGYENMPAWRYALREEDKTLERQLLIYRRFE